MQGSGHGFDLHAAIFCAEGHLVTLADDADLAEPDGLARLEFPLAANADEGRGIAEIVAADQGLILVGLCQHALAEDVALGHRRGDGHIRLLYADAHRQVEIPGFLLLTFEVDGGIAADLHLGGKGDGQMLFAATQGQTFIDGSGLHLCLGVEGDIELAEHKFLRLFLQVTGHLGCRGVRNAAKQQ